jgi:hypothetical protein
MKCVVCDSNFFYYNLHFKLHAKVFQIPVSTFGYRKHRTLLHACPVGDLAELADGPTGCGEEARGGCSFACNIAAVLAERKHPTKHVDEFVNRS